MRGQLIAEILEIGVGSYQYRVVDNSKAPFFPFLFFVPLSLCAVSSSICGPQLRMDLLVHFEFEERLIARAECDI